MKFIILLACLGLVCCNDTKEDHHGKDDSSVIQPLTDNLHVDVYTFIGRFLEENSEKLSEEAVKSKLDSERKNHGDVDTKPHIAHMHEGEMAGLLRVLLLKDIRYENITLYEQNGIGKATSGMRSDELKFSSRPSDLNLGFLTPAIVSGTPVYHYKQNNKTYEERISPIFKVNQGYTLEKSTEGILIGYVSYIVRLPQSLPENQNHGR